MKGITIRPYSARDAHLFKQYVINTYGKNHILSDERYLNWQFDTIMLVIVNNAVVGHFGYKDQVFKIYDKREKVRTLMNLRVDEKYRTLGIGALLTNKVLDTQNHIFTASYKIAAEKLFKHFRSTWTNAGNLSRLMCVLNDDHKFFEGFVIPNIKRMVSVKSLCAISDFSGTKVDYNNLWKKLCHTYDITIERTYAYLSWRFFDNPYDIYTTLEAWDNKNLEGFLVYRFEQFENFKILRIIDLIGNKQATSELLTALIERAKKMNSHAIDFMYAGKHINEYFENNGFFDVQNTSFSKFPFLFNPVNFTRFSINYGFDFNARNDDCFFTKAIADVDRP